MVVLFLLHACVAIYLLLNLVFVHLGHLSFVLLADCDEARLRLQVVIVDDRLSSKLALIAVVESLDLEELIAFAPLAWLFRLSRSLSKATFEFGFGARLLVFCVLDQHLMAFLLDLVEEFLRMAPDLG